MSAESASAANVWPRFPSEPRVSGKAESQATSWTPHRSLLSLVDKSKNKRQNAFQVSPKEYKTREETATIKRPVVNGKVSDLQPEVAPNPQPPKTDDQGTVNESWTTKKLKLTAELKADNKASADDNKWAITHTGQLSQLLARVLCPECLEVSLLVELTGAHQGYESELALRYSGCPYHNTVMTSPKIQVNSLAPNMMCLFHGADMWSSLIMGWGW